MYNFYNFGYVFVKIFPRLENAKPKASTILFMFSDNDQLTN